MFEVRKGKIKINNNIQLRYQEVFLGLVSYLLMLQLHQWLLLSLQYTNKLQNMSYKLIKAQDETNDYTMSFNFVLPGNKFT